jgi:hypothetical protein
MAGLSAALYVGWLAHKVLLAELDLNPVMVLPEAQGAFRRRRVGSGALSSSQEFLC